MSCLRNEEILENIFDEVCEEFPNNTQEQNESIEANCKYRGYDLIYSGNIKDGKAHGIDYGKLTAVLTEAVKQQDAEIKTLRNTLSTVLASQELLLEKLGIKK